MTATNEQTPLHVHTERIATELFERKKFEHVGLAVVTLDELRALCRRAQRATLDELEYRILAEGNDT